MKAGGGGFGGRGFKFDETEASLANDRKKVQAAALGITQDGEEGSADVSIVFSLISVCNELFMLYHRVFCGPKRFARSYIIKIFCSEGNLKENQSQ